MCREYKPWGTYCAGAFKFFVKLKNIEMMEWEGYNYNIDGGVMLLYFMYLSKIDRHA